jgi:hypothetical protein
MVIPYGNVTVTLAEGGIGPVRGDGVPSGTCSAEITAVLSVASTCGKGGAKFVALDVFAVNQSRHVGWDHTVAPA